MKILWVSLLEPNKPIATSDQTTTNGKLLG